MPGQRSRGATGEGAKRGTSLGETAIVDGAPVITFESNWGIDGAGAPYYDDAGALTGEAAILVVDIDGTINLVQPEGVTP